MLAATGDCMQSQPSTSYSTENSRACRQFEFSEILLATDDFDQSLVIGHGGFGKVYKGEVLIGSSLGVAAIKRLDSMSTQGEPEFWAEVERLSKLRHCNLVSLFGYCNYETEKILIYEYMSNGSLEDHLHKLGTSISWLQRLKICIDAARGLDYLHTGTGNELGVIHRDIKSSNILIHERWAAKISDFGLSRICPTNQPFTYVNTLVKGTFGYIDSNYFATGKLTRKSDVYAFGVVLLEVLCRKRAVDRSLDEDQWGLVIWAQDSIKAGNLKQIIDSKIRGQISTKCLKEFVQIAMRCLRNNPKERPTMAEVVVTLESVLNLQEKTNRSFQATGKNIFGRMLYMFSSPFQGENSDLKEFLFVDLQRATRNFSQDCLLGKGGYREMFLCWVDKNTFAPSTEGVGIAVAVTKYSYAYPVCQRVVTVLGGLAHPNIIHLLGYCDEKVNKCLLVYEYTQNQNFGHFLFGDVTEPLSWGRRLMIMIGVARALAYLHSLKEQVIHCDLKPSNIFLDQDFNAKLGGFGAARVGPEIGNPHAVGTFGYLDPQHIFTHCLSVCSDIYSFGVVMLETLTGQRVYDTKRLDYKHNLLRWASPFLVRGNELKKIMDPRLQQNYSLEAAFECAALALQCVAEDPKNRSSSEKVLGILEQIHATY